MGVHAPRDQVPSIVGVYTNWGQWMKVKPHNLRQANMLSMAICDGHIHYDIEENMTLRFG